MVKLPSDSSELESQIGPRFHRVISQPSSFLLRIFAFLGLLFVLQQGIFYLRWGSIESGNPLTSKVQLNTSHPIDDALSHTVHNTGISKYGSKAIVVASMSSENTSWFHEFFEDWKLNIYVVDDKNANLTILRQGGHEGAVFLSYIINNYYNLPDITVFHHAGRFQWHNDDPMFDAVNVIRNLRLPFVQRQGYVNLRCDWDPGCPINTRPIKGHLDKPGEASGLIADLWPDWFPERAMPNNTGAPCCAQFAVTKEQIHKRPVHHYERIRQWLWSTKLDAGMSGRITEWLWHVIFSRENTDCQDAEQCYCEKFGECNLQCPNRTMCLGRWYAIPFFVKLPEDWPVHGQNYMGVRKWGWWHEWYPNENFGLGWMDPETARKMDEAKHGKVEVVDEEYGFEGDDEEEEEEEIDDGIELEEEIMPDGP